MTKSRHPLRLSVATLSIVSLLALPTAAVAVDERIDAAMKHIMECAQLFMSDHDSYVDKCLPQRVPEYPEGATTPQGAAKPPTSSSSSSSSSEDPDPGNSSEPSS